MKTNLLFIKLILAILLFICLLDMPYGYYQFVRFASFAVFGCLAFQANQREEKTETIIFLVLALLFQPFIKMALGRTLWNIVDVSVGLFLIINTYKHHTKKIEL